MALCNTSRTLGKKYLETQLDEDYQKWQKALNEYLNYIKK